MFNLKIILEHNQISVDMARAWSIFIRSATIFYFAIHA